ncbi:MAG: phosphatidate cytidylyltransferase [Endomicrobium sp.]|jgi:phosphatidate cytidylyltransferase|nr:phosphatidate cytidylyltransferase [Endomicrobium sp.]
MLLTRILTAIAGIPLIFACVYFGDLPFFIMMFIVSFFCVQEYLSIVKQYKPHAAASLILASAFFIFLCFFKEFPADKSAVCAIAMLFIFFVLEVFWGNPQLSVERISASFLGSFFLPLAFAHMVYLRQMTSGREIIFFLFLTVWILDTAAYAFGRMFGRHKLAPNVSPKKTIEGAAAGIVFGLLTAVICKYAFMDSVFTLPQILLLGLIISTVGQFSDLAESLVKRDGNIKDSGKIIPGHGGVFDRFDSYIFAAPAVYYFLLFIK